MSLLKRSDLSVFEGWTDQQWIDWLKNSLIDFYTTDKGRFAFKPLDWFFAQDVSMYEEMLMLFRILNETERVKFVSNFESAFIEFSKTELFCKYEKLTEEFFQLALSVKALKVTEVITKEFVFECAENKSISRSLVNQMITLRHSFFKCERDELWDLTEKLALEMYLNTEAIKFFEDERRYVSAIGQTSHTMREIKSILQVINQCACSSNSRDIPLLPPNPTIRDLKGLPWKTFVKEKGMGSVTHQKMVRVLKVHNVEWPEEGPKN